MKLSVAFTAVALGYLTILSPALAEHSCQRYVGFQSKFADMQRQTDWQLSKIEEKHRYGKIREEDYRRQVFSWEKAKKDIDLFKKFNNKYYLKCLNLHK